MPRARACGSACARSTCSCATSTTSRRSSRTGSSRRARCSRTRSTAAVMQGMRGAGRHLRAHRRRRRRARRPGRVLRARGQPARALGRVVHAREPQDDDAALPRALRAATRSRRSTTIPTCCSTRCARSRRQGVSDPTVVLLTPGAYNSRLLRAHLPRAADGHRARRGTGPDRCGTRRSTCARRAVRSAST